MPCEKMLDGGVDICCAHGDTTRYQLAWVQVTVRERQFLVEAGVSDTLPTSVMLGTDAPGQTVSKAIIRSKEVPCQDDELCEAVRDFDRTNYAIVKGKLNMTFEVGALTSQAH